MSDQNIDNIENLSNNTINDEEMKEKEIKPIPEIYEDEDFNFDSIYKEEKKENDKEIMNNEDDKKEINDNNEKKIQKIEEKNEKNGKKINEEKIKNIYLDENFQEEEKVDYFPVDFLISEEEINSIDINIDSKNNINDNDKEIYLKNNFFMTNLASKIKEKITRKKNQNNEQKTNEIKNIKDSKNQIDNKSQEEGECEEMEEIDLISGLDDEDVNNNLKNNKQTSSERLLGINPNLNKIETTKEDSNNNSFHSLSSSLNEHIENKISEIIDDDNKENYIMKQIIVEANKSYIKEQRQQSEKLQEWGLKVIINIIMKNKNQILQNAFYLIKYSKISLSKNRGKIMFKYYQKYREKIKNDFIKKYFLKFKIKSVEMRPREERILNLVEGLNIEDKNIEIFEKIEKLIKEKIISLKKKKRKKKKLKN